LLNKIYIEIITNLTYLKIDLLIKMRKTVLLVCIFVVFSTLNTIGLGALVMKNDTNSSIIYVDDDGPANFTKIQDAINASSDGDTIFVYNGTYYGNLTINKSIALLGESREATVIHPIIISVKADEVDISNLRFHPTKNNTFMIIDSNNSKISYCDFLNFGLIISNPSSFIELSNNLFQEHISLFYVNNIEIFNNEINGIILISSSNIKIHSNTIKNFMNIQGEYFDANHIEISYNKIDVDPLQFIIRTYKCRGNRIHHNDFLKGSLSVFLAYRSRTKWFHNYWGRPMYVPKVILGIGFDNRFKLCMDVDWLPAKQPNCDFGGEL